MAAAASGLPNRFLTLTVNPSIGSDPEERLRLLAHGWRVCVQRLRRLYGVNEINYFAVVEETKQGEPHLHILLRSPFLPQRLISTIMADLIGAPIVDIRAIKGMREVVRYVAKYITKAPKQFGHAKRYWSSRNYEVKDPPADDASDPPVKTWLLDKRPMRDILYEWMHEGYVARQERQDVIVAWLPPGTWAGAP